MARSYRRTPVFGITTCESEVEDRTRANKSFRHRENRAVRQIFALVDIEEEEDVVLPEMGEGPLEDPYSWGRDGKRYWRKTMPEHMRK